MTVVYSSLVRCGDPVFYTQIPIAATDHNRIWFLTTKKTRHTKYFSTNQSHLVHISQGGPGSHSVFSMVLFSSVWSVSWFILIAIVAVRGVITIDYEISIAGNGAVIVVFYLIHKSLALKIRSGCRLTRFRERFPWGCQAWRRESAFSRECVWPWIFFADAIERA